MRDLLHIQRYIVPPVQPCPSKFGFQTCRAELAIRCGQSAPPLLLCWQRGAAQGKKLWSVKLCAHADSSASSGAASGDDENKLAAPAKAVERGWSKWRWEVKQLKSQLQSYGSAGLMAYGLLNTVYYTVAFLGFWRLAKVPRDPAVAVLAGLGWSKASKQFATVMGITWAASQLTKVPRFMLAVILSPTADGLLLYLQTRLRLRTRRNALGAFVAICLLFAILVFGLTVILWA